MVQCAHAFVHSVAIDESLEQCSLHWRNPSLMPTSCLARSPHHRAVCLSRAFFSIDVHIDREMPRKLPSKLATFAAAARKEGYMKKGAAFKPLPRKGTAAYKKIVAHIKQ